MKIAIVGAGYAGLSLALALVEKDSLLNVSIFHQHPINESASSISTGLLYPFVGKYTKKNWKADEGMERAKRLLIISEKALSEKVFLDTGLLKVCYKSFQENNCQRIARRYPENSWNNDSLTFHNEISSPSLFIPEGITVFSDLYIKGLIKACQKKGISFFQKEINATKQLVAYDQIILCAGAGLLDFEEAKDLPVERIKGQALVLKWPEKLPKLKMSLLSESHIALCKDPEYCQIGSTYQRNFETLGPDDHSYELIEKVASFFPKIRDFSIVKTKAAVRLSRVGSYVPIVSHLQKNVWVYGALGSRGLLYHGYLSELLAEAILEKKPLLDKVSIHKKTLLG